MTTLLLRLAGPLQSWGTASRFAYRFSDRWPSKSAVVGLLAAAQGRRRTDPIEDLLSLRFGVRCDQPGTVMRDFQTARALDESYSLPLTYRFYLGDAAFVVGVEGEEALIDGLAEAVRGPAFPLYLGRRSCPPGRPLFMEVSSSPLEDALRLAKWQASSWYRSKKPEHVVLEIYRDALPGEVGIDFAADAPISFDPNQRKYATRAVVRDTCEVLNDATQAPARRSPASVGRARLTAHSPTDWWDAR